MEERSSPEMGQDKEVMRALHGVCNNVKCYVWALLASIICGAIGFVAICAVKYEVFKRDTPYGGDGPSAFLPLTIICLLIELISLYFNINGAVETRRLGILIRRNMAHFREVRVNDLIWVSGSCHRALVGGCVANICVIFFGFVLFPFGSPSGAIILGYIAAIMVRHKNKLRASAEACQFVIPR